MLCTKSKFPAVGKSSRDAGCSVWTQFGEDDGVPADWVVLAVVNQQGRIRGLVPEHSVALNNDADILNVLRPLPQIEIAAFTGGVSAGCHGWPNIPQRSTSMVMQSTLRKFDRRTRGICVRTRLYRVWLG